MTQERLAVQHNTSCSFSFDVIRSRLREIALRALHVHRMDTGDFIALCIIVGPRWKTLATEIAPEYDWDEVLKRGDTPILIGTTNWEVCYRIAERVPGFLKTMQVQAQTGLPQAICVTHASVMVYNVWPNVLDS